MLCLFGRTYLQFVLSYDISTYVSVLRELTEPAHGMFISGFQFISITLRGRL